MDLEASIFAKPVRVNGPKTIAIEDNGNIVVIKKIALFILFKVFWIEFHLPHIKNYSENATNPTLGKTRLLAVDEALVSLAARTFTVTALRSAFNAVKVPVHEPKDVNGNE